MSAGLNNRKSKKITGVVQLEPCVPATLVMLESWQNNLKIHVTEALKRYAFKRKGVSSVKCSKKIKYSEDKTTIVFGNEESFDDLLRVVLGPWGLNHFEVILLFIPLISK